LGLGFESADLGIGEREHGLQFVEFSPLILAPEFGEEPEQFEV
jgi:hypothetical protein